MKELAARRKVDDAAIELYGNLPRVSIQKAVSSYPGLASEAEAALAYVVYLANKSLAHTSASFGKYDEGSNLLEVAFRGLPVLMVNNFFAPLGIEPPSVALATRKRVD